MDAKTLLESLLLDDREERVKTVAGLAVVASRGARDIAQSLAEADEAMKSDPERARTAIRSAVAQAAALHATMRQSIAPLVRFAVLNRKEGAANA
jgi:hypothetical protein